MCINLMNGFVSTGSLEGGASGRNSKKPSPADFMFGTTLGEGAYARVSAAFALI